MTRTRSWTVSRFSHQPLQAARPVRRPGRLLRRRGARKHPGGRQADEFLAPCGDQRRLGKAVLTEDAADRRPLQEQGQWQEPDDEKGEGVAREGRNQRRDRQGGHCH